MVHPGINIRAPRVKCTQGYGTGIIVHPGLSAPGVNLVAIEPLISRERGEWGESPRKALKGDGRRLNIINTLRIVSWM